MTLSQNSCKVTSLCWLPCGRMREGANLIFLIRLICQIVHEVWVLSTCVCLYKCKHTLASPCTLCVDVLCFCFMFPLNQSKVHMRSTLISLPAQCVHACILVSACMSIRFVTKTFLFLLSYRSRALSVTLYQSQNPTSCALGWDIWAQPRLMTALPH